MKLCRSLSAFFLTIPILAAMDAREIVKRSIERDDSSSKLARNYTWKQAEITHEKDGNGRVKATQTSTREIFYIGGKRRARVLLKDGKPLSAAESKKEQEKLDRAIAEANRMTPAQRAKQDAEFEARRRKGREEMREIPEAFDFTLVREERLNGRDAYVIDAKPKPGYKGKAKLLTKMQGRLWIDKLDYQWVKAEAEALDTISVGLFLARLSKGARIEMEQVRVNDEIWLPKRVAAAASARIALLKKFNVDEEILYSDYRKFQAESKIVSTAELEK